MKKMLPLFAGITLLSSVSAVNAGEPIPLTTAQMDNVVAGATVCAGLSCAIANIGAVPSTAIAGNVAGNSLANVAVSVPVLNQIGVTVALGLF